MNLEPEETPRRKEDSERPEVEASPEKRQQPAWKAGLRLAVFVVVLLALAMTVYQSVDQIREADISLGSIRWGLVFGAFVCYSVTLLCSAGYWMRVLVDFGQRPGTLSTLLAFYSSQLGKYVPGKAMVVVIRADLVKGPGVRLLPAVISVFVETLSWIFVGATIASVLLALFFRTQTGLMILALGFAAGGGILTWPDIFKGHHAAIVVQASVWWRW